MNPILDLECDNNNNKEQLKPFLWFCSILQTNNNEPLDKTAFQHFSKDSYMGLYGTVKGFYHAHICSEKYLPQEIELLINAFAENADSIKVLQKVNKRYINSVTSVKEE